MAAPITTGDGKRRLRLLHRALLPAHSGVAELGLEQEVAGHDRKAHINVALLIMAPPVYSVACCRRCNGGARHPGVRMHGCGHQTASRTSAGGRRAGRTLGCGRA